MSTATVELHPAASATHDGRLARAADATSLLCLVLLVAGVPLSSASHQLGGYLATLPLMLPFAAVGWLVARRQSTNPIGWLLLAIATLYTLSAAAGSYAVIAFRLGHPQLPLARLAVALTQCWLALPVLLPLPILLFPDARLSSRRWRVTLRVYLGACVALLIGTAHKDIAAFTQHHVRVDSSGELISFSGAGSGWSHVFGVLAFLIFAVLSAAWIVRQVVAFRRAVGERRQQLKWLMSGGIVAVTGFAFAMMFSNSSVPALRVLTFGFLGIIAVPVSIGVGILKYRLYDIDRVISRTLSYAIVTGLLVGVYVGVVALATQALPLSSPVGVAASTLAVAALFNPVRRRVQRVVDQRFNRSRYDAELAVAAFSTSLRGAVDLDRVERELCEVVQRSVQPSGLSLWVPPPA
jgi:MFS family permease